MPVNEFPYTNLHELNIDWILKIVKDFQEKYGNFDETYQEMLHNIEVAGAEAVEAISADKDTALAAINAFLEQCVSALDSATLAHTQELSNVTNNEITAINGAGQNQRALLAQDGGEYVEQMEALLDQVPTDYRDALNQLQIINSILNENYTYPQIVQGAYPQDSPPTYISAMDTAICTQATAGCAGRTLEINITSGTGVIRQIVYWTGWASPWGGHWESVGTSLSPLTRLTYTFPNDATYFSVTFAHDWGITDNISPSDITVDLIWHTSLTDSIGELKSAIMQKKTMAIPCSFSPSTEKIDLSLSDYSNKKVFVSNRNLLPQFTEMTDHGITCTKNDDGSITLSGTANGTAVITITGNEMPNLGPGTYALSCGNSQAMGDSNTYINVAIDGTYGAIYARFNAIDGKTTFTVPEGSKVTAIRIRISSGISVPTNFKCYPQITEGTNFLEFIPHDGTILSPTSGTIANVDAYTDYTYVCAQSGVSGTVTFDASIIDIMQTEVDALDAHVTELETEVDTLDVRVTALEAGSGKFKGKKIVCFGDSITGNFPAPTDYPSMIAEITGATVYNAGFGGCCMSDNNQTRKDFTMCRLTDSIVAGNFSAQRNSGVSITYAGTSIDYVPERLTMLEGIDWSEIDYITIAYGTNDWNSNYGLDNTSNPLDTTTYIGAFRYSVEKLLTAYPNIKILAITPLWRWWDTNTGMPSEIQADYIDSDTYAKGTGYKLWQYGDALVEAAKWYHIPVFDLYWNCMMTKQNRLEYFNYNDGTHPKLEGRELMAELISAHMESVY